MQSSPTFPAWQTSGDGSSGKKGGEGMVSRVRTLFSQMQLRACALAHHFCGQFQTGYGLAEGHRLGIEDPCFNQLT